MRKISTLLVLTIAILHCDLEAQDIGRGRNAILISPFGLIMGTYGKLRLRVQHASRQYIAYGMDVKIYFKNYSGYQLSPFVKCFPGGKTDHGLYLYGEALYGKNKGLPEDQSKYYQCYGAGGGIGVQVSCGRNKNCLVDFAFGLKSLHDNSSISMNACPTEYADYYLIGPSSIFGGLIAVGFRF